MLWTLRDPHNFPYLDSVFPEASLMPSPLYTGVNESTDTYFSRRKVHITASPMLPKNDTIFWTEEGPKGSICCSHAGLTYLRGRSAHCAKGQGVNNTLLHAWERKVETGKQVRLFNSPQGQHPSGVHPTQSLYSFSMCFQICLFLSKSKKRILGFGGLKCRP